MWRVPGPLRLLGVYWKSIGTVLTPLILLPLALVSGTEEARCGYVILIMAVYWMFDFLPLAVTALIPVAAFPLLGIMSTSDVCMHYVTGTNMLFMGGMIFALAIEESNLHRRIALNAMALMGTSPRLLMIGFMIPTVFISMWISNVATTAMMLPTLEAVLAVLEENEDPSAALEYHDIVNSSDEVEVEIKSKKMSRSKIAQLRPLFFLSVCYAANVGGTGTVIGTSPNLVLMELLQGFQGQPLNFGSWIAFAIPQVVLCLILIWLWLQFVYLGLPDSWCKGQRSGNECNDEDGSERRGNIAVRRVIRRKCKELGPLTFHEGSIIVLFFCLLLLWFLREPGFMSGWGAFFEDTNNAGDPVSVSDATPTIVVVILLFILPAKANFFTSIAAHGKLTTRIQAKRSARDEYRSSNPNGDDIREDKIETESESEASSVEPSPGLVSWSTVHEKMPWKVVLLLGGGFAMAAASERSCLSPWIGEKLTALQGLPDWAIGLVVCILMSIITQIASNVAAASMLLPVLRNLSLQLKINPLYLMLPPTLVSSYAFMLPVSTGPNALAFTPSRITPFEMARVGLVMNILCLIVVNVCINTYGSLLFDLDEFPDWAQTSNGLNNGTTDVCAVRIFSGTD